MKLTYLHTAAALIVLTSCGGSQEAPPSDTKAVPAVAKSAPSPPALADPRPEPILVSAPETPAAQSEDAPVEADVKTAAPEKIMIVLDSSGSMWGQIEGETKRDIAKTALRDMVPELPAAADIGLVAYGHNRKGDCGDIETILPAARQSRAQIADRADGLKALGKTPLTAAVKQAADALAIEKEKSTVILITDGIETCNADPCALGRDLEARGIDFTAHVIGFGLTSDEGQQIACLADETGGLYIEASDAADLGDALDVVTDDIQTAEASEEPDVIGDATVSIPEASVVAGSHFKVEWTGPENKLDGLVVRSRDGEKRFDQVYIYLEDINSPTDVRAPETVGDYDVHYETRNGVSLAHASFTVTEAIATLDAPDEPLIGNTFFTVEFTGPMNQFDQISIVSPDDHLETHYSFYVDNEVQKLRAPATAGTYEVHYRTRENRALATDTITVVEPDAWVKGPEQPIIAGSQFEFTVSGKAGEFDKIRLVDSVDPKSRHGSVFVSHAKDGVLRLTAPTEAGTYQLLYVNTDEKVLASDALIVSAVEAWIKAPSYDIVAGTNFQVKTSVIGGKFDKVVIVDPDNSEKNLSDAFIKSAKEGFVTMMAPQSAGVYTLNYINNDDAVLASGEVRVVPPDPAMKIPTGAVIAGEQFEVGISGKNGKFDKIIIQDPADPAKALSGTYLSRPKDGKVLLRAPKTAGTYTIQYINRDKDVLATKTINVK